MTNEPEKQGKYIYRHKHIGFNGGKQPETPQRKDNNIDEFDIVFNSIEDFNKWFKETTIGLAELDGVLNYCEYFKREKGNEGFYERDGKRCKVNGQWDRYYILGDFEPPKQEWYNGLIELRHFLKDNDWFNDDYFSLKTKYLTLK